MSLVRFVHPRSRGLAVLYIGFLGLGAPIAMAGEPYRDVTGTCLEIGDTCTPATGILKMQVQPSGKALVTLNDTAALESTVLDQNGVTVLFFHDEADEHQVRISQDVTFDDPITKPDPAAHNGKDQVLYRGQCVEG